MSNRASSGMRRILIALDAASYARPALEPIFDLAARLEAELIGLFVEDPDLLRIAAMPNATRIDALTGNEVGFDPVVAARELQVMATAVRRQMAIAGEGSGVRWSFHVVRGEVTAEFAAAAADVDLVVVGGESRSPSRALRVRAPLRAAVELAATAALSLPISARLGGPLLVAYDGSPAADEALRIAAALAQAGVGALEIAACGTTDVGRAESAERAAQRMADLAPSGITATIRPAPPGSGSLAGRSRVAAGSVVVVPAGSPAPEVALLRDAAVRAGCAVLVVRNRA